MEVEDVEPAGVAALAEAVLALLEVVLAGSAATVAVVAELDVVKAGWGEKDANAVAVLADLVGVAVAAGLEAISDARLWIPGTTGNCELFDAPESWLASATAPLCQSAVPSDSS